MIRLLVVVFCLCASTALASDVAPWWPEQFIANWTIYYTDIESNMPPYYNNAGIPNPPYWAGRGITYYDWSIQSMRERYFDFCVPIFTNGSNWRCDFLNTQSTSYLITYDDRPSYVPPCCIFLQPWHPPAPNFLDNTTAAYNGTSMIGGSLAEWWVLDVPIDQGGPFGYAFFYNSATPAAFYFGAVNGWTLQNFFDFTPDKPNQNVWEIPEECKTAQPCPNIW